MTFIKFQCLQRTLRKTLVLSCLVTAGCSPTQLYMAPLSSNLGDNVIDVDVDFKFEVETSSLYGMTSKKYNFT